MNKHLLGRTGLEVTSLGFGGAPVGYLETDHERVAAILNLLLDSGVNLIDTAAAYMASEEVIGKFIGHRRDEYVLVSKCGSKVPDVKGAPWSAELITATVDRALRRLRTDHLDVMLLHSCDLGKLQKGEALGALVKARDAGKIRFAGYSGDNEAAAYAATLPDIAVIETSISIVDQHNIEAVLPLARQNNIGIIVKRPIANAVWLGSENREGIYAGYVAPYIQRFNEMKLKLSELGFEDASSASWLELALRFTLSQPGVHTAIIGTTNPDNAKTNIALADKGPLPAAAVEKIKAEFHKAQPAEGWAGMT